MPSASASEVATEVPTPAQRACDWDDAPAVAILDATAATTVWEVAVTVGAAVDAPTTAHVAWEVAEAVATPTDAPTPSVVPGAGADAGTRMISSSNSCPGFPVIDCISASESAERSTAPPRCKARVWRVIATALLDVVNPDPLFVPLNRPFAKNRHPDCVIDAPMHTKSPSTRPESVC
jgi:hypothetical protein